VVYEILRMFVSVHRRSKHSAIIRDLMVRAVFTWRCKCGVRVKVIGETNQKNPMTTSAVKCPACGEEQIIVASKVFSVSEERDEFLRRND
jgi:hypothetical protein